MSITLGYISRLQRVIVFGRTFQKPAPTSWLGAVGPASIAIRPLCAGGPLFAPAVAHQDLELANVNPGYFMDP